MSEQRIHPAEYSRVPESPATREFVYTQLIDFFGIDEQSELRPGGKRRGFKHTASMERVSEFLLSKVVEHNANHDSHIALAQATIPKVLNELSILNIAGASYSYERLAYFEARIFTDGYEEEHAKEVFKYAPSDRSER